MMTFWQHRPLVCANVPNTVHTFPRRLVAAAHVEQITGLTIVALDKHGCHMNVSETFTALRGQILHHKCVGLGGMGG
eukprot:365059-Chlamydomonas_euryale.AAC.13